LRNVLPRKVEQGRGTRPLVPGGALQPKSGYTLRK